MTPSDYKATNSYKVPKKAWDSWTLVAKHTFNKLYGSMIADQGLFRAPGTEPLPDNLWKVTAWNASFLAAGIVSRGERHLLRDLTLRFKG